MGKNLLLNFAVSIALALTGASVFAGEITLYQRSGFEGQSITTGVAQPNLERSAFNDFASSVVVSDGTWEACTEPNFGGRCAQLAPGPYAKLSRELHGVVASVRQVGYEPRPARIVINPDSTPLPVTAASGAVVVTVAPAPAVVSAPPAQVFIAPSPGNSAPVLAGARVILYQHAGRVMRAVELNSNVDSLDSRDFSDSADAALVTGGVWRLCTAEGGRGHCADFSPGQYASLGALDGRVRSAYLVAQVPDRPPPIATLPAGRAVLYELPNFGGARAVVEAGPAPDLDWARFKNPASSLRIESGSWLVCSDLGYQGECRVLDPGDYPALTGVLDRGIESARQVWRPEYGTLGAGTYHEVWRDSHPDLSHYVP